MALQNICKEFNSKEGFTSFYFKCYECTQFSPKKISEKYNLFLHCSGCNQFLFILQLLFLRNYFMTLQHNLTQHIQNAFGLNKFTDENVFIRKSFVIYKITTLFRIDRCFLAI